MRSFMFTVYAIMIQCSLAANNTTTTTDEIINEEEDGFNWVEGLPFLIGLCAIICLCVGLICA